MSELIDAPMSKAEHASNEKIMAKVDAVGNALTDFIKASDRRFGKLEDNQEKMAASKQLSLGNVAAFASVFAVLVAMIVAVNTMTIKATIHDEVTPKFSELQRRYVARNTAQDIYLNLLWREQHGSDLPPYPPSE